MPSNVQESFTERRSSIIEPNPDTMKYHEVKAEMICNVAVQHMQGWRGATMIHDEHERDKMQQVLEGCNKCGCAMNVMVGATNAAVQ